MMPATGSSRQPSHGENSTPRRRSVTKSALKRSAVAIFITLGVLLAAVQFYVLTAASANPSGSGKPLWAERGIQFLQETLRLSAESAVFPVVAILVAFALGALHAMAPGHNKILTGVTLVGAGARFRHAVLIGATTAFSHTASVLVIGLLALSVRGQMLASSYLRWLGVPSGLLTVALGVWLLLRYLRADGPGHDHEHDHSHGHDRHHAHGHDHEHSHVHHHTLPDRMTIGGLVGLALLHGTVPTLDALAVLLVALNVKQILLGLALILSYSLGIAVVLSAVGMLFLSSQELLASSPRLALLSRWSPAVAAVTVILLGLVIVARTLGV